MKYTVTNIDNLGIDGVQKLIDKNPTWVLVSCGMSFIEQYGTVNFAVFRGSWHSDPFVEIDKSRKNK